MSLLTSLASRFVAGETAANAVRAVRALNAQGARATLNYLGEDVTTRTQAEAARDEYIILLRRIANGGVDANVSVKLTQLGLALDDSLCRDNLARILAEATHLNSFVRVDMEGSKYTQKTLDIAGGLFAIHPNLGVVLQAALRRSAADLATLNARGIPVRLCKGAYKEPADVAFQDRAEVSVSYDSLAEELLSKGKAPAFATHDEERIASVLKAARGYGIGKDGFEFQMLYGLRSALWGRLADDGCRVRIYVPYGPQCVGYLLRRLRERKENIGFVVRNLWRD